MWKVFKSKFLKRFVSASDPVEMKTLPGTEILIGTEWTDNDDEAEEPEWERDVTRTPIPAYRRHGSVAVRGYGRVMREV